MNIIDFYKDHQMLVLLNRYLQDERLADEFKKSVSELSSDECTIAVFGVQGAGKSSFVNALLFNDIVLPVDVAETTCVPTEISYAEISSPRAWIVNADGQRSEIACTETALQDFVHQKNNAGNVKQIDHVEIQCDAEVLKNGIKIVDLPGFGSLTVENQDRTLNYLHHSAAAVFLFQANSLMRESERSQFRCVLPGMIKILPVLNRWSDESNEEVKESLVENTKQLKRLCSDASVGENIFSDIAVVAVKQALDGAIASSLGDVSTSGILSFQERLRDFSEVWKQVIEEGKLLFVCKLLARARDIAENRLNVLQASAEEAVLKAASIKSDRQKELRNFEAHIQSLAQWMRDLQYNLEDCARKQIRCIGENLRTKFRTNLNDGITDTVYLQKIFDDTLGTEMIGFREAIGKVIVQANKKLPNVPDCVLELQPLCTDEINFSAKFRKLSKIHNLYESLGAVGGAAGGAALVMGKGAAIGAMVGGIVPGIGNVIGGVVGGIVGGIIGGFAGKYVGIKARHVHQHLQKADLQKDFAKNIRQFENEMKDTYTHRIQAHINETQKGLDQWIADRNAAIRQEYDGLMASAIQPQEERKQQASDIRDDLIRLKDLLKELTEGKVNEDEVK